MGATINTARARRKRFLCTKCGEPKPRSEFHKDKTMRAGIRSACKACAAKERRTAKKPEVQPVEESVLIEKISGFSPFMQSWLASVFWFELSKKGRRYDDLKAIADKYPIDNEGNIAELEDALKMVTGETK